MNRRFRDCGMPLEVNERDDLLDSLSMDDLTDAERREVRRILRNAVLSDNERERLDDAENDDPDDLPMRIHRNPITVCPKCGCGCRNGGRKHDDGGCGSDGGCGGSNGGCGGSNGGCGGDSGLSPDFDTDVVGTRRRCGGSSADVVSGDRSGALPVSDVVGTDQTLVRDRAHAAFFEAGPGRMTWRRGRLSDRTDAGPGPVFRESTNAASEPVFREPSATVTEPVFREPSSAATEPVFRQPESQPVFREPSATVTQPVFRKSAASAKAPIFRGTPARTDADPFPSGGASSGDMPLSDCGGTMPMLVSRPFFAGCPGFLSVVLGNDGNAPRTAAVTLVGLDDQTVARRESVMIAPGSSATVNFPKQLRVHSAMQVTVSEPSLSAAARLSQSGGRTVTILRPSDFIRYG